jgi:uncharacterized membrane protein YqjE
MTENQVKRGLFSSLRQLLGTVVETVQNRLSLLSTEFEQEKLRLFDGLWLAVLALMLLGIGLLMLSAFIVLLFWDTYRLQALAALCVLFLGTGAALFISARTRLQNTGGLFNSSVLELGRDLASLRAANKAP